MKLNGPKAVATTLVTTLGLGGAAGLTGCSGETDNLSARAKVLKTVKFPETDVDSKVQQQLPDRLLGDSAYVELTDRHFGHSLNSAEVSLKDDIRSLHELNIRLSIPGAATQALVDKQKALANKLVSLGSTSTAIATASSMLVVLPPPPRTEQVATTTAHPRGVRHQDQPSSVRAAAPLSVNIISVHADKGDVFIGTPPPIE